MGKYQYLLFEVARTESETPFGNTFFSEIDVDDGREHPPAAEPPPLPPDVLTVAGKYEIVFEQTGLDERGKIVGQLRPTGIRPKFVELFEQFNIYLPPNIFGYTSERSFF